MSGYVFYHGLYNIRLTLLAFGKACQRKYKNSYSYDINKMRNYKI